LLERNRLHDVAFWFGGDEKEAEELATDEHGNKQKQKHGRGEEEKTFLPRNDTEKHGKEGRRKELLPRRRKERKAIKGAGRPSASSGTGLFTVSEPVELRVALRQAQGPGFLRSVSLSNWRGILNNHIS
jgi:hypothetical protein